MQNKSVTITILGDICPTKDYRPLFDSGDPQNLLGGVVEYLTMSDISIANLEAPATNNNTPIDKIGPNLKAEPEDLKLLKSAGINALSLANNHILDYGDIGLKDTIELCNKLGISTFGAGQNQDEARELKILNVKNKKIGLLSFAEAEFNLATKTQPGANHFDPYISLDDINSAKKMVDYLIILYHGGIEHYEYPSPLLQKKCRRMTELGADLVLCQHSHCIGTIEKHNNSTIVYGQGNTVFGYRDNDPKWNEGLITRVIIKDEQTDIEFIPILATENGISVMDSFASENRLAEIYKMSNVLTDKDKIEELWQDFCEEISSMYFPLIYGRSRVFNKINRVFKNIPFRLLYRTRKLMITLNLVRCEAHNEVIRTILNKNINK